MKKDIQTICNYKITKIPAGTLDFLKSNKEKIEYLKNNKVEGIEIREWHNLVPLIIRSSIAQLISGSSITPTLKANYVALGTDDTPANYWDVKLWAETRRDLFDSRYSIDNVAYLDVYYDKANIWTLNLQEIWVFIDGTATLNTWFLLSRINMDQSLNWLEDLSINISFTILW